MPPQFDMGSMMQMYALNGALGGGMGMGAGMDVLPAQAVQPNVGRYAEGYEMRRALRQGMMASQMARSRMSGMGGMYSPSPQPSFGQGMDPSSIKDPGVANQLLSPYGLQLPTHVNPFLLFNDQKADGSPTWAAQHPKVARAVEGAMIGSTVGPSATTGEAVSNISRTILGMPGLYHENAANQMMAPFAMAKQLAGLKEDQQRIQLQQAQIDEYKARADKDARVPPNKFQPFYIPGQGMIGFNQGDNTYAPSQSAIPIDPNTRPEKISAPARTGPVTYPKGVSSIGERLAYNEMMQEHPDDPNFNPLKDPGWNKRVLSYQAKNAAATGGGSTTARKHVEQDIFGGMSETERTKATDLQKTWQDAEGEVKATDKLKPSDVMKYPGDTFGDRKAAAKQQARQRADAAKRDYDSYVDSVNKASTRPGRIKVTTGTMQPSTNPNNPADLPLPR